VRIALAQTNSIVGDIQGNSRLIVAEAQRALKSGADLVAFPELALSGYPPEDLLLKDHFVLDCSEALLEIAESVPDIVVVVGLPLQEDDRCYNAAALTSQGSIVGWYRKIWLPNYGVFDEQRYFTPGDTVLVAQVEDSRIAITICEDIWRANGPGEVAARSGGASIILNLSMSPYHRGKGLERAGMLRERALASGLPVIYVNGVGGQDELVFDGQSLVLDGGGEVVARAAQFKDDLVLVDVELLSVGEGWRPSGIDSSDPEWRVQRAVVPHRSRHVGAEQEPLSETLRETMSSAGEVYAALCLGVHDYVKKNGFEKVVIGISGGIDSALTACVAVDALGADQVNLISMPSRYSSEGTRSDAECVANKLGAQFRVIPIEDLFVQYMSTLAPHLQGGEAGVTEQNIQARIRGNLLMAMSNKFGWLVLTTGNKSEMAVGYATLYGDMAGGFAVLKDVPKTLVYELAEYRNAQDGDGGPIPPTTLTRAPSAELAPDQTDQDTLPPYGLLDRVIEAYVVDDKSVQEMVDAGLPGETVRKVVAMIDGNEYKRRQSAPGVRITPKAFGKDRRLPITNRYRG
jgi:NAD+ synthase (glutamine-hydrolysing)